jgi:hypothetical protein
VKSLLKVAFVSIFVLVAVGFMAAQTTTPSGDPPPFAHFNPPPCDFSNQFYQDNGLDLATGAELTTEPDGRFGTFRQTGPPATDGQKNWVADSTCATNDPTRRNFRILATTGGNADDGNSPFSCADQGGAFAVPQCPPPAGIGTNTETVEFISILAFIHNQNAFIGATDAVTQSYSRTVGFINGGLQGVQQNPGETISLTQGTDSGGNTTGVNPRNDGNSPPESGISMQYIVGNFEAYATINQSANTLRCPAGATSASQCSPAPGNFAGSPCSLGMIQNLENPGATSLPTFCFSVADTKDSHGNTISDVATPKLRQDWRFATNRNAMDGSDGNCINNDPTVCGDGTTVSINDAPFGYFCDDLLGMWIITYFWFDFPANDPTCGPNYKSVGNVNGFTPDGFPIILTAHELNDVLEGTVGADGVTPCGAEGQEDPGGSDNGAAWLVCPAIPDPRNGAITSDAFLDVARFSNGNAIDTNVLNQFSCLQKGGKFCFESAPGQ